MNRQGRQLFQRQNRHVLRTEIFLFRLLTLFASFLCQFNTWIKHGHPDIPYKE